MKQSERSGRIKRVTITFLSIVIGLIILSYLSFRLSPWPSALLIRSAFNKDAVKTNKALEKYVPKNVHSVLNVSYNSDDSDALLDVYYPKDLPARELLPTIVWVHGGGWISGDKSQVGNYCKILAGKGYTVVSVDYTIAPEQKYPTPVRQTMKALAFLSANKEKFPIDNHKFILAGDSGGAHIVSQTANIIYNSHYSGLLKIKPSLKPHQLKGLLLYCGPYNTKNINLEGAFGGFLKTVLWSYSGTKDFANDADFATANVIDYITEDFPPVFISVGNDDPLQSHSYDLAALLTKKGVMTETLFFDNNYKPKLSHEYQFNLDLEASKKALTESLRFVSEVTSQK